MSLRPRLAVPAARHALSAARHALSAARHALSGARLALALSALLAARAGVARAEPATALDQLEPAPPDDAFLLVPSTRDPGRVRPAFGVILSDAHEPLVLASGEHATSSVVVERQIVMHLQAAVGVLHRFTFDVDMPFTLQQEGDRSADDPFFPSPDAPAVNDLRLGARFLAIPEKGLVPGLALGLSFWAPTGDGALYAGATVPRVAGSFAFGGETPRIDWSTFVEGRFTPAVGRQLIGSQLRFGAAGAAKFGVFRVGPEIAVALGTDANDGSINLRTATIETLAVARATTGPVKFTLAGGPGFGRAPGTPTFRVILGVGVAFDAVKDPPKKAVAAPIEPVRIGPDPKPTEPEKQVEPPPPDGDADGVPDGADACPTEPGIATTDPKTHGCARDSDGDGIRDPSDACPAEPGVATTDPKTHGCPTSVRLDVSQIVILEQVHFKTASNEIDPSSFGLLSEIVAVLNAHPEIARVAVDGHTDNRGADAPNLLLSRKRASAVVQWLTAHGVDARRTEARGFGARQPIADNATDEGRAKNRRVEFNILRKTTDGANGWKDGTVPTNVDKAPPKEAEGKP